MVSKCHDGSTSSHEEAVYEVTDWFREVAILVTPTTLKERKVCSLDKKHLGSFSEPVPLQAQD